MDLKDKIAIVTGGGRGIGAGIVQILSDHGAKVVIFDLNGTDAEEVAEKIRQQGREAQALQGNVTEWADCKRVADFTIEKYGKIDILVNNAGILRDNLITKMPEEDWDLVINVNLKGYWLMSKAVLPQMELQQSGRVIMISSRSWLGAVGQSNYAASKGGVVSLTRALALEYGKHFVTINCIAPGLIDTPLIRSLRQDVQDRLLKIQPVPFIGQDYDIAYTVFFLASDEARYITGQIIHVDGGKSLGARNV